MEVIKDEKELENIVNNHTEILRRSYSSWSDVDNISKNPYFSCLYKLSKKYLYNLDLPKGKVVMLGTHDCFTFEQWKQKFGEERVVGYDIINPSNNKSVIIKDLSTLSEKDDYPCALICNDLPMWIVIPETRKITLEWSLRNIVPGGYYLDSPNHRCCWDLRGYMLNHGFEELLWNNLFVIYKRVK